MIDGNTQRKLQQINMEAAMKHKKDLVKTEKTWKQMAEHYQELSQSARTLKDKKQLKVISEQMAQSEDRVQEINEKAAKEIEREVEAKVQSAIRAGHIPKPDMNDPFVKKHLMR